MHDRLYEAQKAEQQLLSQSAFASGYFPPEYAEPSLDCGYGNGPIEIIGDVESDWYPGQLSAAREPSLYLMAEQEEPPEFALRFTYLPSFSPSVFIRVDKEGDDYWLIVKHLSGAGGYDAGTIASSNRKPLSDRQVGQLTRMLSESAFFDEPNEECRMGFDGTQWIFEQVDASGYRMIKRWSPDEGKARELGELLIELSGLDPPSSPTISALFRNLIVESF